MPSRTMASFAKPAGKQGKDNRIKQFSIQPPIHVAKKTYNYRIPEKNLTAEVLFPCVLFMQDQLICASTTPANAVWSFPVFVQAIQVCGGNYHPK